MCVSASFPHPWHHLHSGGSHGGSFGLLRFVIRGQRGGDAVGRRHWEVATETGLCGSEGGGDVSKERKGDRVRYLAEQAASNVVMLSWKSTLTHEQKHSRKLPHNCCCGYIRKYATTLWKNKVAAKKMHISKGTIRHRQNAK